MTNAGAVRAAVLVVGAGPTGLLLASELERRGVPCHLIDARPAPLHWDRATVVHPRSLEVFESLGVAGAFLAAGCRQRVIKLHAGGKALGTLDLSTCGSIFGFNLGLSEEVTESILTDYLHQRGGAVHRSSRLVGLEPHAAEMRAQVERNGSRYEVDARWVVGCDGLHGATRELSGIALAGHDIEKPWAVFDASLAGWTETFEAVVVYLDRLPVILTALPGRRWRVYMRPTTPESDLVSEAETIVRRYAPAVSFTDVENPTRFHCHTKVAARFQAGAVFLAGDAAHLCSPAEGHGMNCGLQDAFNLAWKLAAVHSGAADPVLLDSYEAERRPVAEMIAQSGDVTEHLQTMTDPIECDDRDRALAAMLGNPEARHHEVVAETELNVDYGRSPIVCGDAASSVGPGTRLPTTIRVVLPDGRPGWLHQLAHRAGHTLMLLGGPAADRPAFVALCAALLEIVRDPVPFEAVVAFGTQPAPLPDRVGRIEAADAARLGVGQVTLLAVRPDGYVGLRSDGDHLKALGRYQGLVCGGGRTGAHGDD